MIFYFSIFVIFALFSILEIFYFKKNESYTFFNILSILLFMLSFIRWKIGLDWDYYYSVFENSNRWFSDNEFEWGIARVYEFVKIYFNSYTFLLFILAVILFSFQHKAISKFSPYPVTSLFILWGISFGNIFFLRQTIATAVLFYSIRFIQEKKIGLFLLMVGTAILFHRTSIIFAPAYYIYHLKLKPITLFFGLLISICSFTILLNFFSFLSGMLGGVVQKKIEFYIANRNNTYGAIPSYQEIIIRGWANKLFIFASLLYFLPKINIEKSKYRGYLNIYWVGLLLYCSTFFISLAFTRFSMAYEMVFIIMIPIVIQNTVILKYKSLVFVILVIYLLVRFFVLLNYGSGINFYLPFRTIFEN